MDIKKTINEYFQKFIKNTNERILLKTSIVNEVRRQIKLLESIKFKRAGDKFKNLKWKDNNEIGASIAIDLPIVRVSKRRIIDFRNIARPREAPRDFMNISKGTIVIDNKDNIIAVFITEDEDPDIKEMNRFGRELCELMEKYFLRKRRTFGFKNESIFDKRSGIDEYLGKNWIDGMIKYFDRRLGRNVITYRNRNVMANIDENFLFKLSYTYSALYMMERKHIPQIANKRLKLSNKLNFPGAIPGLPLSLLPSTTLAATVNFASRYSIHSTADGLTDSYSFIPPNTNKNQIFVCYDCGINFICNKNCVLYVPQDVIHATADTGNHGGCSFINLSKENLLFDVELNKEWYAKWRSILK